MRVSLAAWLSVWGWRGVGWGGILRRASVSALDHDVLTVAQAVAYSAMLSLFPALIVAAAAFALLPETVMMKTQLALFFSRLLPLSVTPLLESYFAASRAPYARGAILSALVVSLSGAVSVMATLMEGFRRAHELPLLQGSFWPRRLRALVLVPLSLVPMTAASGLVMFGHVLTRWAVAAVAPELARPVQLVAFVLRWGVALAGSVGILAVIYHLGTDLTKDVWEHLEPLMEPLMGLAPKKTPWWKLRSEWTWRASLPGAAVATGLWFLSTLVFGVYVTRFANYSRVYGSVGAAIALMVWLYLIALSVLLGAEFNAERMRGSRDPETTHLLWKLPGLRKRRTGRMAH